MLAHVGGDAVGRDNDHVKKFVKSFQRKNDFRNFCSTMMMMTLLANKVQSCPQTKNFSWHLLDASVTEQLTSLLLSLSSVPISGLCCSPTCAKQTGKLRRRWKIKQNRVCARRRRRRRPMLACVHEMVFAR